MLSVGQFIKNNYIIDWIVIIGVTAVGAILYNSDYFDRSFSQLQSDVSLPEKTITITSTGLYVTTYAFGGFLVFSIWSIVRKEGALRVLVAYYFCISITFASSSLLMKLIRRPGPDTEAVCGSGLYEDCKKILNKAKLSEQFKSTPSDFAAESMASGLFISLLLCKIWKESCLYSAVVKFAPIFLSLLVGCSCIWDRRNRPDDVALGFIIGFVYAFCAFKFFVVALEKEKPNNPLGTSIISNAVKRYV